MGTIKTFKQYGGAFTSLVPFFNLPRDPSTNLPQPTPTRQTVRLGAGGTGAAHPGLLDNVGNPVVVLLTVDTISDLSGFTDKLVIELGNFKLLPYLHYLPVDGDEGATAAAVAAAISSLVLFSAEASGADIIVFYNGNPNDIVPFRVLQNIGAPVFTDIIAPDGCFTPGGPYFGAPELG